MKKVILLSVVILLISLAYSFAEVPCKINYQGRLIKDNVPVDGTKPMVFSIYPEAVGGSPIWTSGNVNITVYNGLFRYVIGSNGGDLSSIPWTAGQELYLEVIVDGETLTPREELYAYPYAINSHLLEGETKEYFLNTSGDTQTKQGNLNIIGNVGIGTTAPVASKLHLYSTIENEASIRGQNTNLLSHLRLQGSGGNSYVVQRAGKTGIGPTANIAATNLIIDSSGNVGIGTTSPGAKLDVQGGAIKATGGLIIETGTTDPTTPATGQMWLRTD